MPMSVLRFAASRVRRVFGRPGGFACVAAMAILPVILVSSTFQATAPLEALSCPQLKEDGQRGRPD
jgi:hypothetical protein